MTDEFDRVRASFASSHPARALAFATHVAASGWRSSVCRRLMHKAGGGLTQNSAATLIRTAAVAIAVAAALQLILMRMMPLTVRPATPQIVFIVIAGVAAVAAVRPEDVAAALPSSRFASWLRR